MEIMGRFFHISDLITALEWLAGKMNEQFGLKVHLDAEAEKLEHPHLKVLLFRALQELLFNIVKHAGVKSAHVGLSSSNGGFLVTVADRGKGFDPGILESSDIPAGLGLIGLRERTCSVGGDLVIESAPGQGSRFTLKVPQYLNAGKKSQQFESAADRSGICLPVGHRDAAVMHGIRVLFADGHKVMRQGLIRMISGNPDIHVIGEAANGCEVLDRIKQLRPDVVVMGVSMPVMERAEIARRIKAEYPQVRVIGFSLVDDDPITRTMREGGAEIVLSKSASVAELLKAIYGMQNCPRMNSES